MDLLLSLPIISYYLSPATSSWSTSLNLLFFYMTWSTLILSHPPLRVHLAGLLALRTILCLGPSLLFLLADSLVPSLAESLKLGGVSALPPRRPAHLARLVGLAVFNLVLGVGVEGAVSWALGQGFLRGGPAFKTSTTLPFPWQIAKHVCILFAAREVLGYHVHRYILHAATASPSSQVAKLHARHAHARSAPPFSLAVLTDHPIAYVLHRIAPLLLPALALRPHLLTYFVFVALVTLEETLAMSGYSVVPGIIMGGIARRTAAHYAGGGRGNFGAWGVLDWACGTSQGRDVIEDVKAEAEKHRLKGRGEDVVSGAVGEVQKWAGRRRSKKSDS